MTGSCKTLQWSTSCSLILEALSLKSMNTYTPLSRLLNTYQRRACLGYISSSWETPVTKHVNGTECILLIRQGFINSNVLTAMLFASRKKTSWLKLINRGHIRTWQADSEKRVKLLTSAHTFAHCHDQVEQAYLITTEDLQPFAIEILASPWVKINFQQLLKGKC